jgi:DNA-nicking Smr family endonuclease
MKERENQLREFEALIMAGELGEPAEIDLHDQIDTHDGVAASEQFIDASFMAGERVISIVHGKGHGRMRSDVQRMLADHELVEYFRDSSNPGETMGVTYVVLAQKSL